mgnify:CR=1 FL=1
MAESYVYLILDRDSGLTKIGFSHDPIKRLKELTSQKTLLPSPHNFDLIEAFTGTMEEEKMLHNQYVKYRVRGEWFDLLFNDRMDIGYCFEYRPRHPSIKWLVDDNEKIWSGASPSWSMITPETHRRIYLDSEN